MVLSNFLGEGSGQLIIRLLVTTTSLNNQSNSQLYINNFKNKTEDQGVDTSRKRSCVGLFHRAKPCDFSDKV